MNNSIQSVKKPSKKQKKKKKQKEEHEAVMKAQPPSCYSCSAHEDDFLRIIPYPHKSPPTCKSCGVKLSGKYGYLTCAKSASCFHLCSVCQVCPKNHILRHVIALKHLEGSVLYAENKFKCHGCKKEKMVTEKGVLQCIPCSLTICRDCQDATEQLWEAMRNKEEEEDEANGKKIEVIEEEGEPDN